MNITNAVDTIMNIINAMDITITDMSITRADAVEDIIMENKIILLQRI